MGFLKRWFANPCEERRASEPVAPTVEAAPAIHNEQIPGALDLGLYYSESKDQVQVAKVARKDRATHMYVVGATGTGKTKFLESLIRQDIGQGNGFGVIDPHGDLTEEIKGFLALLYRDCSNPSEAAERVVLVDPADARSTVTFNPLEQLPGVSAAEQAAELVSAFRRIWADSWGARMEDLLRSSLIALGEAELTLGELPLFLTQRAFRRAALAKVGNPTARAYFGRFDAMTDRAQLTWIEPVMNKVNAFLADERLRQMFSATKSTFDLREVMDRRRMLLVKLEKGKLKDAADLLGSLLMAKIQLAAFSRSSVPEHQRIPFYLYIDEFQNFASESFKVVLSEARKYRLALIMAHQSLSQISDDLRGQILGSAGLQVYFRVNRQDAQVLAKEAFAYSGFEVKSMSGMRPRYWSFAEEWEHKIEDLQHLPPRHCYAKHKIQGGIVALRTDKVEPARELLGMSAQAYAAFVAAIPLGREYLVSREEVAAQIEARRAAIEAQVQARPAAVGEIDREKGAPQEPPKATGEVGPESPVEVVLPQPAKRSRRAAASKATPAEIEPFRASPEAEKEEREHRRLQHLIKRLAEQAGYRATLELPTGDGQGRVDVGLERDGRRVAFEVSVSTSAQQELANIEKCLRDGYDRIILCSPEKKTLEKASALVIKKTAEADQARVVFLAGEDLALFFEEEAAAEASTEGQVKGYKVKVHYRPVEETEKQSRRQAIARVLLGSLRREKQSK